VRAVQRPGGQVHVACATAVCTSSMPMPSAASCRGSSCTRTAYFWEPKT
jgi:hypothetical protein